MHQTSSQNHPRSNGFAEHMAGVAKKLMDKAGKEKKPWISGLFEYRITPQAGSIASPLQLMSQCRPREKNLPQPSSALGAQEMHQMCHELIRSKKTSQRRSIRCYSQVQDGFSVSCRCVLKIHLGEEIAKFNICSHVHRTVIHFIQLARVDFIQTIL